MRNSVRDKVVCPKCKSALVEFTEVSEAYEKWVQDADGNITGGKEDGVLVGGVTHVKATCMVEGCGHVWTVRGLTQVTELPNWSEGNEEKEIVSVEPTTVVEPPAAPEPVKVEEPAKAEGKKGKGKKDKKAA